MRKVVFVASFMVEERKGSNFMFMGFREEKIGYFYGNGYNIVIKRNR